MQQLKGFARLALKRGEQARVSFTLPVNLLAFFDQAMRWVVEPGEISVQLGSSSADIRLQGSFSIGGALTEVSDNKAYLSQVSVTAR